MAQYRQFAQIAILLGISSQPIRAILGFLHEQSNMPERPQRFVSCPSSAGLAAAARQSGPQVARIWSSGLPSSSKAALGRFYSIAAPFDPATRVIGAPGRASSNEARLSR
jgi:hypothetical protein